MGTKASPENKSKIKLFTIRAGKAIPLLILPTTAFPAIFLVSDEAQLRQAIIDANSSLDASSEIRLQSDILIASTEALPDSLKTITINTTTFKLTSSNGAPGAPGTNITHTGQDLTLSGSVIGGKGGSDDSLVGGSVVFNTGIITNYAQVTGGIGGDQKYAPLARAGAGGAGIIANNATVHNNAAITGGEGGNIVKSPGDGMDNSYGGQGGVGLIMNEGSLVNDGQLIGGKGGAFINNDPVKDNEWSGVGGRGAVLNGGNHVNNGSIIGGEGGIGINIGSTGTGYGNAGEGVRLNTGAVLTNTGEIIGGDGRLGGSPENPTVGSLGNNGASVNESTLINTGTISGGNAGSTEGPGGGGYGITAIGSYIINSGTITPGVNGDGSSAAAISLDGTNTLEIQSGSTINGIVSAQSGDVFRLGGSINDTFDTGEIGASQKYQGFGSFEKVGTSTWTLTGTPQSLTPWAIREGVLSISTDSSLGTSQELLSFYGGTLQTTADVTMSRNIQLLGTGTFLTTPGNLTVSGQISGSGAIIKDGPGLLVLNGSNTYTGSTTVNAGALIVNGDQSAATGLTQILSGGTLGGKGIIGGSVSADNGATISPGLTATEAVTLTVKGDLNLSPSTTLDYNFWADADGSILNDVINVDGALTLDGTINVIQKPGAFIEPGIYRVINYQGSLTDNTLVIGSAPIPDLYVQSSIPSQINLVSTGGLILNFWDGALPSSKNNDKIDGGDGVWKHQSSNDDSWTNYQGAFNAPFADGAYAIFSGAPGNVTVDTSFGDINVAGMQFATDGYTINGGSLNLSAAQSPILVGDGTQAGSSITATINSALAGIGELVKAGIGTLVLTAENTYTGGTDVRAGTLQISSDKNLGAVGSPLGFIVGTLHSTESIQTDRPITIDGRATFLTDASTTFETRNTISGSGALNKLGTGELLLTGLTNYAGPTLIAGGTLSAGSANSFSASSAFTVQAQSNMNLNGLNQTIASLSNAGHVKMGSTSAPGVQLHVAGNYTADNGMITMGTQLGGDSSPTDRLLIAGDSSGSSSLRIININGQGAPTTEGIKVVDVTGASNGTFRLIGDYDFEGQPAIVGGAYAYRLQKNSPSNPSDGDWYLNSRLLATDPTSPPIYQPGVPLYEAYSNFLLSIDSLGTYKQRSGSRSWLTERDETSQPDQGIWLRTEGRKNRQHPNTSTTDSNYDSNIWRVQLGASLPVQQTDTSTTIAGLALQYSDGRADVNSVFGDGEIKTTGYGLLGTLSWTRNDGLYVDGQLQAMRYDSDLKSKAVSSTLEKGNKGSGFAASIETGKSIPLSKSLAITPQAQLTYSTVSFDKFTDQFGAEVKLDEGDSLVARVGTSLDYKLASNPNSKKNRSETNTYAIANISQELLNGSKTDISGTQASNRSDRTWISVGLGMNHGWAAGKYNLYGELQASSSLQDVGESYGAMGTVGVRVKW